MGVNEIVVTASVGVVGPDVVDILAGVVVVAATVVVAPDSVVVGVE